MAEDDDILAYDPYAGDFGGCDDRPLSDRMVVAAKLHPGACHICVGDIAKGERHRRKTQIFDGNLLSNRWCLLCCEAMAINQADAGEAICARQDLHGEIGREVV